MIDLSFFQRRIGLPESLVNLLILKILGGRGHVIRGVFLSSKASPAVGMWANTGLFIDLVAAIAAPIIERHSPSND